MSTDINITERVNEVDKFPGFEKFDTYNIDRDIVNKALKYVGGNCSGILHFIKDKILGFNKGFDYISSSQFETNLNFSDTRVARLVKLAEEKEVIFTHKIGSKGQERKYFFFNTETYRKIIKAVRAGLLNFEEILKAEKKFMAKRSGFSENYSMDEQFKLWKESRDSYFKNIADSFEELPDGKIILKEIDPLKEGGTGFKMKGDGLQNKVYNMIILT